MTCDRCGIKSLAFTGSYFNMEIICLACQQREAEHPQYEEARRVETEAVQRGDFNFAGIGLPADLGGRLPVDLVDVQAENEDSEQADCVVDTSDPF